MIQCALSKQGDVPDEWQSAAHKSSLSTMMYPSSRSYIRMQSQQAHHVQLIIHLAAQAPQGSPP